MLFLHNPDQILTGRATHGGNLEPRRHACEVLDAEGHNVLLWCPEWNGDAHPGRIETSLLLEAATEDLVRRVIDWAGRAR